MRYAAWIGLALMAVASAAPAAETPTEAPAPAKDVIIRTLPGIVVDTKAREVRLEGTVCLQRGALELFVCSQNSREHESVIVVKAKPSHVTFALSLLGLAPGKPGFATEGGAFSPPAGEMLDVAARFKGPDGKDVEVPAWRLMCLAGSDEGLDRAIEWVYVGRPEEAAMRAADREGTVVCLSNFTEAVIDVPFESTSVNASLLYMANPKVVPPRGTPVELIIRPAGKRIEPVKVEIDVALKRGKPIELDGKPIEPDALKEAVGGMPVAIRTAVLRAEPDERFGRVMEVNDILRNALMRVHMVVLLPKGAAAPAEETKPPLKIVITSDDQVVVGTARMSAGDFRAKASDLLKGVERVSLLVDAKAAMKTVAEVMAVARDSGAAVTLAREDEGK
ncbi:MAG: hypothetical protein IMZ66_08705 [Planctomycetes bacterium]|nr:hypothetical protein [Planctomycetota bacterium]